jgi:hypothetical protein
MGFALLLFTFFILLFIAPNNEPRRSFLDARMLTKFVLPNFNSIQDGTWMKITDEFVNDRIPFRESLISTYVLSSKYVFRQPEPSGVWTDPDTKMLFDKAPKKLNLRELERNLLSIERATDEATVPLLMAYVPRKQEVFNSKLPKHWDNSYLQEKPNTLSAFQATGSTIDLTEFVGSVTDWYLTDHHWSDDGARSATVAIHNRISEMNLPIGILDIDSTGKKTYPDFIGSIGRTLTMPGVPARDKFTISWPTISQVSRCENLSSAGDICTGAVILDDFGNEPSPYANRYAAYLGGDNPIDDIRGPGKGTYIVLKDSFGNSLVPFLALSTERIVAVDERHYREGNLTSLIKAVNPDGVIVLHNQLSLSGFSKEEYNVWR